MSKQSDRDPRWQAVYYACKHACLGKGERSVRVASDV